MKAAEKNKRLRNNLNKKIVKIALLQVKCCF